MSRPEHHGVVRAVVQMARHLRVRVDGEAAVVSTPLWKLRVLRPAVGPGRALLDGACVPLDECRSDAVAGSLAELGLLVLELQDRDGVQLGYGIGPLSIGEHGRSPGAGTTAVTMTRSADTFAVQFVSGAELVVSHKIAGATFSALDGPTPTASGDVLGAMVGGYSRYSAGSAESRPRETWQEAAFRNHADLSFWKDPGTDFGASVTTAPGAARRSHLDHVPLRRIPPGLRARVNPHFAVLAEARRSERQHAGAPVQVDEVAVHVSEVCRYRSSWTSRQGLPVGRKAVPSAGGLHPLEVLLLQFEDGGQPRVWQYHAVADVVSDLGRLSGPAAAAAARLGFAAKSSTGAARSPQVLLFLASEDSRLHDKYSGFAYANAYKDAGSILTALQLSVVGSGLGLCPLGATIEADVNRCLPADRPRMVVFGVAAICRVGAEAAP